MAHSAVVQDWNFSRTAAPWWRWYLNDRSGWTARLGNKAYGLDPEHVVLIAPESNFLASSTAPAGHLFFHFLAGPPFHTLKNRILRFPSDAAISDLAGRCREQLRAEDPIRLSLTVQALCGLALMRIEVPVFGVDERVLRVTALMQDQAELNLSNEELARRIGMHPNAFIRWFKRALRTTPQAWQMERRVERACGLLRYTERSIEEIAAELGFCDRFYFSRVFRRHRACSPSMFRKHGI